MLLSVSGSLLFVSAHVDSPPRIRWPETATRSNTILSQQLHRQVPAGLRVQGEVQAALLRSGSLQPAQPQSHPCPPAGGGEGSSRPRHRCRSTVEPYLPTSLLCPLSTSRAVRWRCAAAASSGKGYCALAAVLRSLGELEDRHDDQQHREDQHGAQRDGPLDSGELDGEAVAGQRALALPFRPLARLLLPETQSPP